MTGVPVGVTDGLKVWAPAAPAASQLAERRATEVTARAADARRGSRMCRCTPQSRNERSFWGCTGRADTPHGGCQTHPLLHDRRRGRDGGETFPRVPLAVNQRAS